MYGTVQYCRRLEKAAGEVVGAASLSGEQLYIHTLLTARVEDGLCRYVRILRLPTSTHHAHDTSGATSKAIANRSRIVFNYVGPDTQIRLR